MLGLIRIVTGVLVLYVHLAYAYDLQSFFGKNAWIDLATIDRERHESPALTPAVDWDSWIEQPNKYNCPLPDSVDIRLRHGFIQFLQHLPEKAEDRKHATRYLTMFDQGGGADTPAYLEALKDFYDLEPEQISREVQILGNPTFDPKSPSVQSIPILPQPYDKHPFTLRLKTLDPEGRVELFSAAIDMRDALKNRDPYRAGDESSMARVTYLNLVDYMMNLSPFLRKVTATYIFNMDNDFQTRKEGLAYFDYWTYDRRVALYEGKPIFSVWFHVTDPTAMVVVHTLIGIVILMFTIGLYTRITSVLTWFGTLFYIHRCQQILFGMDTMSNILLLYLMIGPSGAAFSIDRLRARYRASARSWQPGEGRCRGPKRYWRALSHPRWQTWP